MNWQRMFELKQDEWIEACKEIDTLKAELEDWKSRAESMTLMHDNAASDCAALRSMVQKERERNARLVEAMNSMVIMNGKQPCYRTVLGVPQQMPKGVERKVRQALQSAAKLDEGKKCLHKSINLEEYECNDCGETPDHEAKQDEGNW